jgi:secondary thiamine-phosphate synthase enzyme
MAAMASTVSGMSAVCHQESLALVNAMHFTASVFINSDESGLHHDYEVCLEGLAPHAPIDRYQHNHTGEDNADAHLKRQVMGREVVVAVTNGLLDFGSWEQIFYWEFDGRRHKRGCIPERRRNIHSCCSYCPSSDFLVYYPQEGYTERDRCILQLCRRRVGW